MTEIWVANASPIIVLAKIERRDLLLTRGWTLKSCECKNQQGMACESVAGKGGASAGVG